MAFTIKTVIYKPDTMMVWGWGMLNREIHEFMGFWKPEADPPYIDLKWKQHSDVKPVKNIAHIPDLQPYKITLEEIEKIIPDFEAKIMGVFIYQMMDTPESEFAD